MNLKAWLTLFKTAVNNWIADYAPSMGAALAYYTVFSLAPLLVIVIAVAALVFGEQVAQQEILAQARGLVGDDGASTIETMIRKAQEPKEGTFAAIMSIITLFIGATTVFNELESDINRVWKTEARKGSGIWHLLRTRLLSFGMVLAIGFLLLVSLLISAALSAWGRMWAGWFGGLEALLHALNFVVSIAVITLLFALMYKFLPRVKVEWKDVWVGAVVTALLFTLGKFLIGLYIGKSSVASSYGAAGALAVLLLWVYYSAQILLLGAEFTKAYAEGHGSMRQPAEAPRQVPPDASPTPA